MINWIKYNCICTTAQHWWEFWLQCGCEEAKRQRLDLASVPNSWNIRGCSSSLSSAAFRFNFIFLLLGKVFCLGFRPKLLAKAHFNVNMACLDMGVGGSTLEDKLIKNGCLHLLSFSKRHDYVEKLDIERSSGIILYRIKSIKIKNWHGNHRFVLFIHIGD